MPYQHLKLIYLAGRIVNGHDATQYRTIIAPLLKEQGIVSLDPIRGKYRGPVNYWKNDLTCNELVTRDLQDIDRADILLAVIMKCEQVTFGTPIEIYVAHQNHIPSILVTDDAVLAAHPWVKSLCSRIRFVEPNETFGEVLHEIAKYIGYWYGSNLENEVYMNPVYGTVEPLPETCPCGCNPENCAGCENCTCGICGDSLPCNAHDINID